MQQRSGYKIAVFLRNSIISNNFLLHTNNFLPYFVYKKRPLSIKPIFYLLFETLHNNRTVHNALFLAALERRAWFFLGATLFFEKNQRFFSKNSVAPVDFFKGRLLSVAKNSPLWIVQLLCRV